MWLYDVSVGKAVTKSVHCVSSRARKKKERTYRYCIQAFSPGCIVTTEEYKNKGFLYKRVFLLLFCCKEERMYKLGLYVMGVIW